MRRYFAGGVRPDGSRPMIPEEHSKNIRLRRELRHVTEDQTRQATHDIGNLTLTLDNSVYGNKGFEEKKGDINAPNCYANSVIFMEKDVARYSEWTNEEFLNRRKKIIKWIKERWHLGEAKRLEIEIEEDSDIDEIGEGVVEVIDEEVVATDL